MRASWRRPRWPWRSSRPRHGRRPPGRRTRRMTSRRRRPRRGAHEPAAGPGRTSPAARLRHPPAAPGRRRCQGGGAAGRYQREASHLPGMLSRRGRPRGRPCRSAGGGHRLCRRSSFQGRRGERADRRPDAGVAAEPIVMAMISTTLLARARRALAGHRFCGGFRGRTGGRPGRAGARGGRNPGRRRAAGGGPSGRALPPRRRLRCPARWWESTAFAVGLALGLDSPPDAILAARCDPRPDRDVVRRRSTLLMAALAVATPLARLWNGIALRVAGSWIAAMAILVLALRWAS